MAAGMTNAGAYGYLAKQCAATTINQATTQERMPEGEVIQLLGIELKRSYPHPACHSNITIGRKVHFTT